MLVVTSNWCVSDGTLSAGPPRGCVERFRAEVRRASLRCGFRRDGSYRPVDAIDVVLAGDTFDWLISREWTGDLRPWNDGRRAAAARERVVSGAARRSHRLQATLAAWMQRGIEVPMADRRGRPMPTASRPVPVRVAVLCGERDRWLEQAAGDWQLSARAPMVGRCWSDGDVTVRHGDDMDPLHATCGGEPTLGESLAVDLIARFGVALDDVADVRPLAASLVRRLACGAVLDAPTRLVGWLAARDGGATLTAARGGFRPAGMTDWIWSARSLSGCGATPSRMSSDWVNGPMRLRFPGWHHRGTPPPPSCSVIRPPRSEHRPPGTAEWSAWGTGPCKRLIISTRISPDRLRRSFDGPAMAARSSGCRSTRSREESAPVMIMTRNAAAASGDRRQHSVATELSMPRDVPRHRGQ